MWFVWFVDIAARLRRGLVGLVSLVVPDGLGLRPGFRRDERGDYFATMSRLSQRQVMKKNRPPTA